MTGAEEQLVVKAIDARLAAVAGIGRVVPAPLYFQDRADFFNTWEAFTAPANKEDLETAHVAFCSFWLDGFTDDPTSSAHSPTTTLNYAAYLFSEYDPERLEESELEEADDFQERRMLRRYQAFVGALLGAKAAFQGHINLGVLDASVYVKQFTSPLAQTATVETGAECRFIPGVRGLAATIQIPVTIREKGC